MTSTNNDYGEKRNFIRMFINAEVTITDPTTGDIYNGESRDLSGDGVSIVTNNKFELNQELEVHIRTKDGSISPLTAMLDVRRVKELDDGLFEIGGFIHGVS